MFDEDDTTEEHERRIVRCTSGLCRARIIFLPTSSGRQMPCDADSVEPADMLFDPEKHVTHFRSCADPGRFRRPR